MKRDWRMRFWPYDVYERHAVVGRLLRDRAVQSVLDVGGRAGLLSRFTAYHVTALNVDGSGDVLYDGDTIPFSDGRFDAVVAIDTLEHLPQSKRLGFLKECLRVARQYLVIAAPFGSAGHISCENRLNELYRQVHGRAHIYLDEHVRYGLPTEAQLRELVQELGVTRYELYFAGDYQWQGRYFERALLNQDRRSLSRLRVFFDQIFSLALFHPVKLASRPYPSANRFYLFIEELHT